MIMGPYLQRDVGGQRRGGTERGLSFKRKGGDPLGSALCERGRGANIIGK